MFEVGKRYRSVIGREYECTAVGRQLSILGLNDGDEYSVLNSSFSTFTEIRPNRRIEAWVNVYDDGDGLSYGVIQKSKDEAIFRISEHKRYIDTIKIEYEEK